MEDPGAYLEHDRHAAEILSFFLARFQGRRLRDLPEGGIRLLVKTRYDALPGFVVMLTVCSRRVGAVPGGPLDFVLFNWTGGGCTGYHYDLLVRRSGPAGGTMQAVIELAGGDEGSAGHGGEGASGSFDAGMHDPSAGVADASGGSAGVADASGGSGAEKGGVADASGGSGGTEAVSGGRPLSLESTPVKSPPRKVQRVCAECKDVFEDAEDVSVSLPTSVETPVQSPVVKCPRCGPSPAGVGGAGVTGELLTGLAPVPAMPFGSRGADEVVDDPRGEGSRWRRFTPRVIDESLCMARNASCSRRTEALQSFLNIQSMDLRTDLSAKVG